MPEPRRTNSIPARKFLLRAAILVALASLVNPSFADSAFDRWLPSVWPDAQALGVPPVDLRIVFLGGNGESEDLLLRKIFELPSVRNTGNHGQARSLSRIRI